MTGDAAVQKAIDEVMMGDAVQNVIKEMLMGDV